MINAHLPADALEILQGALAKDMCCVVARKLELTPRTAVS
jgi:hypothetical protein